MCNRRNYISIFVAALFFATWLPGKSEATIVNGTITGVITGLGEVSFNGNEPPAPSIFGFGAGTVFDGARPEAVGEAVVVNYQFDTNNAPIGDLAGSDNACDSVSTGRCTFDADRAPGNAFISASITINGNTHSLTGPSFLATTGLQESTLTIENNFNSGVPNIPRDHVDIRIESTGSQVDGGVTTSASSFFNTNFFRSENEGLLADLSLNQEIDWDLDRDGVDSPGSFNEANFSFTVNRSDLQFAQTGASAVFDITNWQQSAADDAGTTAENPLLPVDEIEGGFVFDAPVNSDSLLFIDPLIAIGYDYETGNGDPNFASVLLPEVGDGIYDLILFDQDNNPFDTGTDLFAGVVFDLTTIDQVGFTKFGIRGIEISAGLDPDDPTAFVTGLGFVNSGQFTGTMSPVTEFVQTPEPSAIALFGIGVLGLGFVAKRRRSQPG